MGESWRKWSADYGKDWETKFRQKYETEMIQKYDAHFFVSAPFIKIRGRGSLWACFIPHIRQKAGCGSSRDAYLFSVASRTIRTAAWLKSSRSLLFRGRGSFGFVLLLNVIGVPLVPLSAFSLARGLDCISLGLLISYFGHVSSLRLPGSGSRPCGKPNCTTTKIPSRISLSHLCAAEQA
jgi:hypothetical protein